MKNIDKLHIAISIANQPQIYNRVFAKRLGISHIVENLEKFEYEISCLSKREDFSAEEAEDRYIDAVNSKKEYDFDKALYRQEGIDNVL